MLVLGGTATLAANADYGAPHGVTGELLSGSPAIAFVGSVEIALGMVRRTQVPVAVVPLYPQPRRCPNWYLYPRWYPPRPYLYPSAVLYPLSEYPPRGNASTPRRTTQPIWLRAEYRACCASART